jgi:hypothetical protein
MTQSMANALIPLASRNITQIKAHRKAMARRTTHCSKQEENYQRLTLASKMGIGNPSQ